jgi:hypothetical protein
VSTNAYDLVGVTNTDPESLAFVLAQTEPSDIRLAHTGTDVNAANRWIDQTMCSSDRAIGTTDLVDVVVLDADPPVLLADKLIDRDV